MTDAKPPASLAEALAALQAQMPAVGKHASGKVSGTSKAGNQFEYTYHYAPGEDITPKLYPLMAAVGLSFSARPDLIFATGTDRTLFVLRYELRHVSGESAAASYPLPDPDRYGPQDLGKAITYARRYALCALVGLFPGGDDSDANGMQEKPGPAAAVAPAQRKAEQQARSTPPAARQRRIAEERARHDDAGHDPAKVTRRKYNPAMDGSSRAGADNDPWEGRPPDEREQAPGTINDLQLRAIWMLLKDRAGVTDNDAAHAMARAALGLADDALLTDPDENGEVRETFRRLSHAQAADFIRQLQDGAE